MPLTIPLRKDLTHFDLEVALEGTTYRMFFYWNTRERFWYFDIFTEEDEPIITSIKFVIDAPLGRRTANPLRPPGVFIGVDTSGDRIDPGYNDDTQTSDLGDRVKLIYFESSELPIDTSA